MLRKGQLSTLFAAGTEAAPLLESLRFLTSGMPRLFAALDVIHYAQTEELTRNVTGFEFLEVYGLTTQKARDRLYETMQRALEHGDYPGMQLERAEGLTYFRDLNSGYFGFMILIRAQSATSEEASQACARLIHESLKFAVTAPPHQALSLNPIAAT